MKFLNEKLWIELEEKNKDPYGSAIIRYAKRWAEKMEGEIEKGKVLADIAEKSSSELDNEGITGFMYGCAVKLLSETWIFGEDLRKWHNIYSQIGHEGEMANETGGCLNPAILQIGE